MDWYHDESLEGEEYGCKHCATGVYYVELVDDVRELRHVDTNTALSADGTHVAEEGSI